MLMIAVVYCCGYGCGLVVEGIIFYPVKAAVIAFTDFIFSSAVCCAAVATILDLFPVA